MTKDIKRVATSSISRNAYFLMLGLAVLMLGLREFPAFEPHPHARAFLGLGAIALVIGVPAPIS